MTAARREARVSEEEEEREGLFAAFESAQESATVFSRMKVWIETKFPRVQKEQSGRRGGRNFF